MTYSIPTEALDRYDTMLAEGRIIGGAWTREEDGRHLACVLAALSPDVAEQESADACPGDWMPGWLAERIVQVDDMGSAEVRAKSLQRLSPVLRGLSQIPGNMLEPGGLLERRDRVRSLVLALSHLTEDRWGVREACVEVLRLLEYGGTEEEWATARAASRAASDAAWTATWTATSDAAWTAFDAARTAAKAAADASAALAAADASAAWDDLNAALLSDLEAAIADRDLGPLPCLSADAGEEP